LQVVNLLLLQQVTDRHIMVVAVEVVPAKQESKETHQQELTPFQVNRGAAAATED
jgi:hypothetical protein